MGSGLYEYLLCLRANYLHLPNLSLEEGEILMLTSPLHFIIHTHNTRVLTLNHDLSARGTCSPLHNCFTLCSICTLYTLTPLCSALSRTQRNRAGTSLCSARTRRYSSQSAPLGSWTRGDSAAGGLSAQRCKAIWYVHILMNAKALSIMSYQDDINTALNMKSICRAAVAQWTKRLTRIAYTRVRNIL